MFFRPMTVLVVVVLGVLLLLGIAILLSALGSNRPRCGQCQRRNRKEAKFCARCGAPLAS